MSRHHHLFWSTLTYLPIIPFHQIWSVSFLNPLIYPSQSSLFSQVSITSIKAHSLLHSLTHPHSVHSSLLWGLQPQETLPLLIPLYPPLSHTGHTAPDCPLHPASLTMIADTSSRLHFPVDSVLSSRASLRFSHTTSWNVDQPQFCVYTKNIYEHFTKHSFAFIGSILKW